MAGWQGMPLSVLLLLRKILSASGSPEELHSPGGAWQGTVPSPPDRECKSSSRYGRADVTQSGPMGLRGRTWDTVCPLRQCPALLYHDGLTESFPELNPLWQEEVEGGRCSALLRADLRQQQKLNEPFKERKRSAGTSVPGSVSRAMSRAGEGNLCPSSSLQRLPGDPDSIQGCGSRSGWCGQELSAHLSGACGLQAEPLTCAQGGSGDM